MEHVRKIKNIFDNNFYAPYPSFPNVQISPKRKRLKMETKTTNEPHPILNYEMMQSAISNGTNETWEMDDGQDEELHPITESLLQVHRPFAVGGSKKDVYVDYSLNTTSPNDQLDNNELKLKKKGVTLGPLTDLKINEILVHGTVAPFGRGAETVVDEKVRRAIEISAADIDPSTPEKIAKALQNSFNTSAPFDRTYEVSIAQIKDGYDNNGPKHVSRTTIDVPRRSIEGRIPN